MGSPAPDDGDYFKKEQLVEYDVRDLPTNLRKYGASDHAVSAKARRDYTVIGCVGIDEQDDIWVLPDLVWERMETDRTVEELLVKFKDHQPMLWWMEDEMISKAFGPFLLKRMHEEKVYTTTLDPIRPAKDMRTRARSIQGRMQMRKVHFPKFAPWWQKAKGQMLIFDSGANDDFVSFMSLIGQGLTKELKPPTVSETPKSVSGSIGWMLADTQRRAVSERKKAVW
jgi:predicted phage terminase large subunit-like protein